MHGLYILSEWKVLVGVAMPSVKVRKGHCRSLPELHVSGGLGSLNDMEQPV